MVKKLNKQGSRKKVKLNLKPSARDKRRYMLIQSSNKKIEEALLEYLGILGVAKAAYKQVKPNGREVKSKKKLTGQTIGSCLTKSLADVRTALGFKDIKITKVSGTIKGLGLT